MENENKLQQKDIDHLTETLSELKVSMGQGFAQVYSRLDIMDANFAKKDSLDRELDRLENIGSVRETRLQGEIDELKDSNKWLVRTVATFIIGAILTGILIVK